MKKAKQKGGLRGVEKEVLVNIESPERLLHVAGEADTNLKVIEKELEVRVLHSSEGLLVSGQDTEVDLAVDLLTQLSGLVESGENIFKGDVQRAIGLLSANRSCKLETLFRHQITIPGSRVSLVPKNFSQKKFVDAITSNDVVFGIGPAGTGKTYLAIALALSALLNKRVKRVVLCRPAVEAGEKLGFLPGDMAEKVNPYLRPLFDALFDMVGSEKIEELFEKEMLEVAPLAFMRGRTMRSAFVILDEAQNTTPVQMKMFLTRLGEGSKFYVTGDVSQIDLARGQKSGLVHAAESLKDVEGVGIVRFSESDVIRHALVERILRAYARN